ncbi:uncharacterized protein LOC122187475 [Lagopus leucura]|uniref:uncharacterized protein LOC122187475 n=1 Tax=Lagopus leucura TaxID=30410 RepID=UPI001C665532|nr:uncharacterized protein LOC122187475 [Lagopus leucura]
MPPPAEPLLLLGPEFCRGGEGETLGMLGPKRARYKSSAHPDPSVAGWGSPEPPARGGGRVCVRVPSTASAGAERGCPAAGAHAGGEYRQPLAPPPAALLFLPGRFGPEERHRRCRGSPKELPVSDGDSATPGGPTRAPLSPAPPTSAGSAARCSSKSFFLSTRPWTAESFRKELGRSPAVCRHTDRNSECPWRPAGRTDTFAGPQPRPRLCHTRLQGASHTCALCPAWVRLQQRPGALRRAQTRSNGGTRGLSLLHGRSPPQ